MPQIASQLPFQTINSTHRSAIMIPPTTDKKAKTNFSIDWIVQNNNEPASRQSLPKDYDREIYNALRLEHSPTQLGLTKPPSPGRPQPSHTIAVQQTCISSDSNIQTSFDDRSSSDRITPESSLNEIRKSPTIHQSPPHPVQPQLQHLSHQRPAPYRPIPFPHSNYPHGGPNANINQGGPGPIRTGGSAGGINDSELVVAQLQFIAAMSYRQQQHQFANMQHPSGLHPGQLPPGHPHAGMPPSSLMYAQGHLAPPQFHNDATVAYPLAPWLINRHGRLMARPFSHGKSRNFGFSKYFQQIPKEEDYLYQMEFCINFN